MKRAKLKWTPAQLAKRYENPAAPVGFTAKEWGALRAAHKAGVAFYQHPTRPAGTCESFIGGRWVVVGRLVPFVGPQIRHAPQAPDVFVPFILDAGCTRCGEALDAKARDGLCSPCDREAAAKARLAAVEARDHRPRVDVPYLQVVEAVQEVTP